MTVPIEAQTGPIRVFVYGTLKPGHGPYGRFCQGRTVAEQAAMAAGAVYHLPLGYPGLVAGEDLAQGAVQGYLLTFADGLILEQLDDYEQHDPVAIAQICPGCSADRVAYQRQEIAVYEPDGAALLCHAWAYVMTQDSIQSLNGQRVTSGNWGA
jgi:gamma-glutamylcyclotransferase (GGCT)/AIG2-like uncharacterized protein YtfP